MGDHAMDYLDESLQQYNPTDRQRCADPLYEPIRKSRKPIGKSDTSEQLPGSIGANIATRFAAEQIAELADGEAEKHGNRFWKELASIINAHVPFPAVRRKTEKAGPMCDKESRLFGQQTLMPFGEFTGMKIDDVPLGRLEWYADQTFMEDLRRYLQSERVKRERG